MKITRRSLLTGAAAVATTTAVSDLVFAESRKRDQSNVSISIENDKRLVTANGLPDHATGDFPNRHDPVPLWPQKHKLEMPLKPVAAEKPAPLFMWLFGVAVTTGEAEGWTERSLRRNVCRRF